MSKSNQANTNKTNAKSTAEKAKGATAARTKKATITNATQKVVSKPRPKVKASAKSQTPASENDQQHLLTHTEMEVHHHPELSHKPKPFKEYLLEGFMIFIAVMLGFIAENIREDITDGEHVHQLTIQLVHELKADTAQLNKNYAGNSSIDSGNNVLFKLLQQPIAKADQKKIEQLAENAHSMWLFRPSSGAVNAIKNELHLKQFSNSDIITYFSKYEKDIELLRTAQDINLQYQKTYLDPFLTEHFTPENLDAAFNHATLPDAQMRNLTQGDLTQFRANMVLLKVMSKELITSTTLAKKDATDLLNYVTKHYQIDNK